MVLDGGDPRRRRRGRRRRLRGSRLDSLGGEGEELEAELTAALAWAQAAGVVGDWSGKASAARVSVPRKKKERER